MERNIPGLLLIHMVFFVLSAPLCAATSGVSISKVVHISNPDTWHGAQTYCRHRHSDLVTINNQSDDSLVLYEGWIGLRHMSGTWTWSRGDEVAEFIIWEPGYPNGDGHCVLKHQLSPRWENHDCTERHPFLCDERLILVQEKKTWKEALLHCRHLEALGPTVGSTTHPYDLASLPEAKNILLDRETIRLKAATNEVWVGLRFLAGEWLWMSGQAAMSCYLSRCPADQQHCGALVHNNTEWKVINCNEKRNFLCSIKTLYAGRGFTC